MVSSRARQAASEVGLNDNPAMSSRWWTFLVWALVSGSLIFWAQPLWFKPMSAPPQTQVAQLGPPPGGDLARVLGADTLVLAETTPPPVVDARFTLVGVLSPRNERALREGIALIAIDGKAAKSYRVGAVVEGQQVLQSVGLRSANLGPRGGVTTLALKLPALPEAQRGSPGALSADGAAPSPGASPALPIYSLPNGRSLPGGGRPMPLPGMPTQALPVQDPSIQNVQPLRAGQADNAALR